MKTSQRRISRRIRQFVTAACLTAIGSGVAWAAQINPAPSHDPPTLVVPGYGPGIAGQVIEGPTTPVCRPNTACTRPYADATVLMLDRKNDTSVGATVTNTSGNFLVTVPPGVYLVHVLVVDFPRCNEVQATVGQNNFTLVQVICDTGIR